MQETQLVQDGQLGFSQVEKLLHKLTWSGMSRLARINCVQQYDDMFQEVFLVYMQAAKAFDPSRNYKFSTYLQTSVQNFFSDYIKRNFRQSTQTDSLDEMEYFEYADTSLTPEEMYAATQNVALVSAELSSLSKLVLLALLYPSDELLKKHAECEGNGGRAMDVKFVTRHILSTRTALHDISEERVQSLAKKVCNEFRKATRKLTGH